MADRAEETQQRRTRSDELADVCPITPIAEMIFNKWTAQVLWSLIQDGRLRFTELRRRLPAVTPKVPAQRLRQLDRDGLVIRTYHPEDPPRVEYEATRSRSLSARCSPC